MTTVVHFCGRMFAEGQPEEAGLRARIDTVLDEEDVASGFGALACGADILMAEALLARTARLVVILPFDVDQFAASSVAIGGKGWIPRYHTCLQSAAETHLLNTPSERPYRAASDAAMGAVLAMAARSGQAAFQLALLDPESDSSLFGTSGDMSYWRAQGGRSRVIEIPAHLRLMQT